MADTPTNRRKSKPPTTDQRSSSFWLGLLEYVRKNRDTGFRITLITLAGFATVEINPANGPYILGLGIAGILGLAICGLNKK